MHKKGVHKKSKHSRGKDRSDYGKRRLRTKSKEARIKSTKQVQTVALVKPIQPRQPAVIRDRERKPQPHIAKNTPELNVEPTQQSEVPESTKPIAPKPAKALPRQLLRVQRSEPGNDVVRTELRFVSYHAKSDLPDGPIEAYAVGEALSALIGRLEELKMNAPQDPNGMYAANQRLEKEIALLRQDLQDREEDCQQLKARLLAMEEATTEYSRSIVEAEPEWVQKLEQKLKETIAKLERQRQQASRMEPELEQAQRQLHDIAARLEKYRSEGRLHQREVQERLARRLTEIRDWTLQADRQKRREKHKSAQVMENAKKGTA